jgi:hypothetical protein
MSKENWLFEDEKNTAVFTTSHVIEKHAPIAHVSHDIDDGSWQFHSEKDPQSKDAKIVALSEIVKLDSTILELADLPIGWKAWRESEKHPWVRINTIKTFQFKCSTCGKTHEGSPSFSFEAPYCYLTLTDEDKSKLAKLNEDFCTIENKDYFIRTVLEIPILGQTEPFTWGVWSSLSEKNFHEYVNLFKKNDITGSYFSWLSNQLPFYPDTLAIETTAHLQPNGLRPKLTVHSSNHPLSQDFQNGISWEKAVKIAEITMHRSETPEVKPGKKKWWKFF